MNGNEMRRMYMRDGKLWMAPEIRSAADIRKFFGNPAEANRAQGGNDLYKDRQADYQSPVFAVLSSFPSIALLLVPVVLAWFWRHKKG